MAHLIDKSALVAEIWKRIKAIPRGETDKRLKAVYGNEAFVLNDLLSFINTLEVKEVDLEREQRMKDCPYRQVGCTMYDGHILECKGACSWVVDYPKLKELKAQEGE